MEKCFLDLDGVLVDFTQGICDALGKPNPYTHPETAEASRGVYGMEPLLDVSSDEFWAPCDEGFWAELPWMPDGRAILAAAEEVFGRKNICLLTSPCANDGCPTGKMRWIKTHLPEYKRQFLIGPPKHFCAHGRAVLIDDYDKNVDGFREHGGHAILVPRIWNSGHKLSGISAMAVVHSLKRMLGQ